MPCLWSYWLCCTSVVKSPRDSLQSPLSPNLCMSAGLAGEPVTPHYKNKEAWLSLEALLQLWCHSWCVLPFTGVEMAIKAVKALLGCTLVVLQKVTLLLTGENNWLHSSATCFRCAYSHNNQLWTTTYPHKDTQELSLVPKYERKDGQPGQRRLKWVYSGNSTDCSYLLLLPEEDQALDALMGSAFSINLACADAWPVLRYLQ